MATTTKQRNYSIPAAQIDLFDVDEIKSASVRFHESDHIVKVYDDGIGQWYLFGREFGPEWLVRADSFQSAWEIVVDEMPTINESEVEEAYYLGDDEQETLHEGYEYQSNASGTGIVDIGHDAWQEEIDPQDATLEIVASGIHADIAGEYGAIECLLDGARGICLPQHFAEMIDTKQWSLQAYSADLDMLRKGPDHEEYWEAWDTVLNAAEYTDSNGDTWTLWQDGDLLAVRSDVYFD